MESLIKFEGLTLAQWRKELSHLYEQMDALLREKNVSERRIENLEAEIESVREAIGAMDAKCEPSADCERLDARELDCLERGDANPCNACREWDAWKTNKGGK